MPSLESPWGTLYYTRSPADAAAGPPLLLVHGAGESVLHWPAPLRRSRQWPVYALDLPGHGRSGGPACNAIEQYVAAVHHCTRTLALPPFVLAGHSMGGAIALTYALRYPTELAGLVLVGTGARLRVAPRILEGLPDDFDAITAWIVSLAYAPQADPALRDVALQRIRENDPRALLNDFIACNAYDVSDRLAEICAPTLILCGLDDRLTPPRLSQALHAGLPDSRLHWVEGAGHIVPLERPRRFQALVEEFVRGLAEEGPDAMAESRSI